VKAEEGHEGGRIGKGKAVVKKKGGGKEQKPLYASYGNREKAGQGRERKEKGRWKGLERDRRTGG
jgi:hypothetical protein